MKLGRWAATALLPPLLAACATTRTSSPETAATGPPDAAGVVGTIDSRHRQVGHLAASLVDRVDRVFGEPRVEDRERKVIVKSALNTTFNDEGQSTDTTFRLSARVPLPALERRTNAFFDLGGDVDQLGEVTDPNYNDANRTYSLAATFIDRYRDFVDLGIKISGFWDGGPDFRVSPFLRFDQRREPWRLFFEQRLSYDTEEEWRTETTLDVDRLLSPSVLTRFHNSLGYPLAGAGVDVAHALLLRHPFFARSGFSWEWWLQYATHDRDVDKTYGQLRWRGRVWRDWLEYELSPAYTFPIDQRGRHPFFSVYLSLTVLFEDFLGSAVPGEAPPPESPAEPAP